MDWLSLKLLRDPAAAQWRLAAMLIATVGIGIGCASPLAMASVPPAPDFLQCLQRLGEQAAKAEVSQATIDNILGQLQPVPRVVELDRSQPEVAQTFAGYFPNRVTEQRVTKGRELLHTHGALLNKIHRETGVAPRYLLAFWGLETNFGSYLGNHRIPDALATLACDTRRSDYFSAELVNALKILEAGDVSLSDMKGSWAGAMGNVQFMPTTFLRYATDADGDGKRDLWGSVADALTSAGRYLQGMGWQSDVRWGREVLLPADFDYSLAGSGRKLPLREFAVAGVTTAYGHPLPTDDERAALLVLPAGHRGPAFLTYQNFQVIMGWNPSLYYALAVGQLADQIGGGGTLRTPIPDGPANRALDDVRAMQAQLTKLGLDTDGVDGRIGPATRRALAAFQQREGLIADGYPDATTLARLMRP